MVGGVKVLLPQFDAGAFGKFWRINQHRRADPRNGICLNALHDRAFDRGLLTFDEQFNAVVSPRLSIEGPNEFHSLLFRDLAGRPLQLPQRFHPDAAAMRYHRNHVFQGDA